jgi:hypothetical protein
LAWAVIAVFGLHLWAHGLGEPSGADLALLVLGGGTLVVLMVLVGRYAGKHSD